MTATREDVLVRPFRREPTLDFSPVPGMDLIAHVFDLAAGT
jgi:hypothetical protein